MSAQKSKTEDMRVWHGRTGDNGWKRREKIEDRKLEIQRVEEGWWPVSYPTTEGSWTSADCWVGHSNNEFWWTDSDIKQLYQKGDGKLHGQPNWVWVRNAAQPVPKFRLSELNPVYTWCELQQKFQKSSHALPWSWPKLQILVWCHTVLAIGRTVKYAGNKIHSIQHQGHKGRT